MIYHFYAKNSDYGTANYDIPLANLRAKEYELKRENKKFLTGYCHKLQRFYIIVW